MRRFTTGYCFVLLKRMLLLHDSDGELTYMVSVIAGILVK